MCAYDEDLRACPWAAVGSRPQATHPRRNCWYWPEVQRCFTLQQLLYFFLWSLLDFTYWFPLKNKRKNKNQPVNRVHLSSLLSRVHGFKLYYGPGLAYTSYFIMHEVICTHTFFFNAPGNIYYQCSGFKRNVQQGEFIASGGWEGDSEDNYLLYMKTHFS